MQKYFLPTLTLLVLALILADRLNRDRPPGVAVTPTVTGPEAKSGAAVPHATVTQLPGESGTPTIERLARLATRRTLSAEGRETYLDSLLLSTDSVLRRWPVPLGRTVRVALIEGGPSTYAPRMSGYVRQVFGE